MIKPQYENGYVVLPIENYEALVAKANESAKVLDSLITLKENYNGTSVEVIFNDSIVYTRAKELFANSGYQGYELAPKNTFSTWGTSIANRVREDL